MACGRFLGSINKVRFIIVILRETLIQLDISVDKFMDYFAASIA